MAVPPNTGWDADRFFARQCRARIEATMTPDQLIRPEIQRLSAYHVADATGMVKLDAMENP